MERVLIVEDDRTIHKALRLLFEAEGYAVEFVTDGEAALASFRASLPGLVILDLRLPKMPRNKSRMVKKRRRLLVASSNENVPNPFCLTASSTF